MDINDPLAFPDLPPIISQGACKLPQGLESLILTDFVK